MRLPQPHARPVAVLLDEDDASSLERAHDVGDGVTVRRAARFGAADRVEMDAGFLRKITDLSNFSNARPARNCALVTIDDTC